MAGELIFAPEIINKLYCRQQDKNRQYKEMREKKLLAMSLLAAMGVFMLASCTRQPSASFNVSKTSPIVGESVYFTNSSLDANSYEWDFGDGTSSTMANPSHTYYTSGSKLVTLTAYSKNRKKSSTATALVEVKAVGDFMFWTDESTTYNITVTLEKAGTKTITSYYYYAPSDCGASGCATFNDLEEGTYYFTAKNLLYYWSGYATVEADKCKKMLLYHSKAEKQLHPENQSTEQLTQGVDITE